MQRSQAVEFVQRRLQELAVPENAGPMAAYMKSTMPFYGVKKAERKPIERELKQRFRPATRKEYEQLVLALWRLPHREEKYLALAYAGMFKTYITCDSIGLFETLIREGAWWDLVDDVAVSLVGGALLRDADALWPRIDAYIDDQDLWIRRTALICQIKHREKTDQSRLFRYCLVRAAEKEFFIRKAIGWALRAYAKTAPQAVIDFLGEHGSVLSGLSYREAAKRIGASGKAVGRR